MRGLPTGLFQRDGRGGSNEIVGRFQRARRACTRGVVVFWQGHKVALKGGGGLASRVLLALRQEGFQWVAGRVLSEGNDNNE